MKNIYFDFIDFIFSQYKEQEDRADFNKHGLQITPITLDENYAKEWNVSSKDFVCITKNGELLNPTLYRIGMGTNKIKDKKYFILLKYVESIYDFKSIKRVYPNKTNKELELKRKHLESRWCILDEFGVEKMEFTQLENPHLIEDSCIYSIGSKYYNVETKELYCESFRSMTSKQYLFLDNRYDTDKDKIGILKIDKITGKVELFK